MDVPNLSVTISTHGGLVLITVNINYNAKCSAGWGRFTIIRDNINLGHPEYGLQIAEGISNSENDPSAMIFVDNPTEGTHIYKVQIASGKGIMEVCEVGQLAQIAVIEFQKRHSKF